MRTLRVYIDTSVIGAVFDVEFQEPTKRFFQEVAEGRFSIVISALVEDEIEDAPREVRNFYSDVVQRAEVVTPSRETILLQRAYIDAGVVTEKWAGDALHVATAAAVGCDMIVSWNFRHIVHFDKRRKYNAINVLHGYDTIDITTPAEVIEYEEDI